MPQDFFNIEELFPISYLDPLSRLPLWPVRKIWFYAAAGLSADADVVPG
jgi:hypothetical protein